MKETAYRIEKDSMGEVRVPSDRLYGAQTKRALENFTISDLRIPSSFLKALALVKECCAKANCKVGVLDENLTNSIVEAAKEIATGNHDKEFPIDVFQTGSGTSWNMNINEVIANIANAKLGAPLGSKSPIHPNDHVNRSQSSNDVIPTAMNIAARLDANNLVAALKDLAQTLKTKELEFSSIYKLGRTHLQDAVPMKVGQEFSAWKSQIEHSIKRISNCFDSLEELALGGTAIGSGLNCPTGFKEAAVNFISKETGVEFCCASNPFEAISARDSMQELMGALNTVAVSLFKIANDVRLLSSGPRCGFGELILPSLQPGSSIMPGKVNPVMCEMMIQVAATVMGLHTSVTIGCQTAPLQLNIMMPLIAYNVLFALSILTNAVNNFNLKAMRDISVDKQVCQEKIEYSLSIVTPLALRVGYDKAAQIAHYAYENKIKIYDAVLALSDLSEEEVAQILSISNMVKQ